MLLSLVPDAIKLPAAVALGAILAFYPARWFGQSEGRQMAATAALSKSVQVLRERSKIDDQISSSDSSALCSDFFVPDSDEHGECVRRLAEASVEASDGGLHNPERQDACERDSKPQ